jgi:hypothetical protein
VLLLSQLLEIRSGNDDPHRFRLIRWLLWYDNNEELFHPSTRLMMDMVLRHDGTNGQYLKNHAVRQGLNTILDVDDCCQLALVLRRIAKR